MRTLLVTAISLPLLITGCTNCQFSVGKPIEERVQEAIEGDGYDSVVLTPGEEGAFTFTARKSVQPCTGTATVSGTSINWNASCEGVLPYAELEPLCTSGNQSACALVAKALVNGRSENGETVPVDVARSTQLFVAACEAEEMLACFYVGLANERGDRSVPANPQAAYEHYDRACSGEIAEACHNLANMILQNASPSPADQARVSSLLATNCTEEQTLSCGLLGRALADGRHMPQNEARARELMSRACESGQHTFCGQLGLLHLEGRGGPASPELGASLLTRACEAGDLTGCTELGRRLGAGANGLTRDPTRAQQLLQRACTGGYAPACQ